MYVLMRGDYEDDSWVIEIGEFECLEEAEYEMDKREARDAFPHTTYYYYIREEEDEWDDEEEDEC